MNTVLQEDFEQILHSNINFDQFKNSRFLITGATGLIGSLLIKYLLYCDRICHLDLHIYALVRNEKKAKNVFEEEIQNPHLTLVKADLLEDDCAFSFHVDHIIHTAAVTASKQMVEQPIETIFTSIEGLKKILDYAVNTQSQSVVYLSSMEVYGQMKRDGKVSEEQLGYVDLSNARSSYPESKRMCECICTAYAKERQLNVKSIRLAQTFGAGISRQENRVFAQFTRSAMRNEDIILHTKGQSEGNYVYTSDAITAIFTVLTKGARGEIYNVNNENSHLTIAQMAELVAQVLGNGQIKVIYDIPEDASVYGFAPDTKLHLDASKIMTLGWKPKVELEESYRRLARWIKDNEM